MAGGARRRRYWSTIKNGSEKRLIHNYVANIMVATTLVSHNLL
jgi:hypothetical protein